MPTDPPADDLQQVLNNHTWSIHLVGTPVISSLLTVTCHPLPSVDRMRVDATAYLRRRMRARKRSISDDDAEGDYVTCSWLTATTPIRTRTGEEDLLCPKAERKSSKTTRGPSGRFLVGDDDDDDASSAATGTQPRRKRKRKQKQQCAKQGDQQKTKSTQQQQQQQQQQQHLCVNVFVREEWSACVVFCGNRSINEALFDLCLARGQSSSRELILQWMATVTSCHIGCQPLRLPSTDLVEMVGRTIVASYEHQHKPEFSKDAASTNTATALVLQYQMPRDVPGIETLSLTVPPQSVSRLCRHIRREQQMQQDTIQKKGQVGEASHCAGDSDDDDNESSSTSSDEILRQPKQQQKILPVVRAMECFVQEHFGIDVSQLQLCQIETAVLSLGCDGSCKLMDHRLALSLLQEIVVRQRNNRGGSGCRHR